MVKKNKNLCLSKPFSDICIWISSWQDLQIHGGVGWSCFYLILKASTPKTPTSLLIFKDRDIELQLDQENLMLLGETRKLQTNLLPSHYACAWHSLPSSLALNLTGFPELQQSLQNLLWIPRKSQNALPDSPPSSTWNSARKWSRSWCSCVLLARGQKNAIKAEETNANL